jgi:Na+/H+-translocating membrane pyrophosphatase
MDQQMLWALVAGALGLLFAGVTARRVLSKDRGNARMQEIQNSIREGAMAFLRREFSVPRCWRSSSSSSPRCSPCS